jgi:hypothetical protein
MTREIERGREKEKRLVRREKEREMGGLVVDVRRWQEK